MGTWRGDVSLFIIHFHSDQKKSIPTQSTKSILGGPDIPARAPQRRVAKSPALRHVHCRAALTPCLLAAATTARSDKMSLHIAVEGLGAKRLASVLTRCTRTPAASCSSTGALLAPPHPPCAGAGRAAASVLAPQVIITAIYQLAVCGLNSGVVPGCSSIRRFSMGWGSSGDCS